MQLTPNELTYWKHVADVVERVHDMYSDSDMPFYTCIDRLAKCS